MWQGSKILSVEEVENGLFVLTVLREAEPYKVLLNLTPKPAQMAGSPKLLPWETMVISSN